METVPIKTYESVVFHGCRQLLLWLFLSFLCITSAHAYAVRNLPCPEYVGDPISTFYGELTESYPPDLNLGGVMPLFFQRYYGSLNDLSGMISGNLGNNWLHTFDMTLTTTPTTARVATNRSRAVDFILIEAAWVLQPGVTGNLDTPYQFVTSGTNFIFLNPQDKRSYTFNAVGQLISISDGKGNTHSLSYNGSGQLTQVTDGLGRALTFNYLPIPAVGPGTLTSVSDGTRVVSFAYTGTDLTAVTDVLGNVTSYTYMAGGLMTSETRPTGNISHTQAWDLASRVITQTDSNGNTITLAYVGNTTITDPLGATKVHSYTAKGSLSNNRDEAGLSVVMSSDATGRRSSITDRMGDTTSYSYHAASGQKELIAHADGTTTAYVYSPRTVGDLIYYDLSGITHADTSTESFVFDASGNLVAQTNQTGDTATSTYNANGQPLTETNWAGGVVANSYNADGTMATTTDPAGNTTTYGYDALTRRNLITFADASTVSLTRDSQDNLLTRVDENGNTTTKSYDVNGNLTTIKDPSGNTTTFAYDGNNQFVSVTDPLGGSVTTTYDPLGRVATVTDANGNVTTVGYDTRGRQTSLTDPLGNIWANAYDAEGVLTSRSDPLGNTTTFISDKMGRNTQTSSPLGNSRSFTYDVMGRIATSTDPLGGVTTLTHDVRGQLTKINLPGTAVEVYAHNTLGLITQATDPNGNNWNYAFDNQGRQISSTDPLGNVSSYAYDTRNRLSVITYPGGLGTQATGYDAVGNPTSRTYSDGTTLGYTYDANNRLIAANNGGTTPDNFTRTYDANGRISNSNGIAISRDAGGRITSMTLAPGKTVAYDYDANDRLISVTDWTTAPNNTIGFSYDTASRLTSITRPNGISSSNTYDNDSRLTSIVEGDVSSITLTRDGKGQITAAVRTVPEVISSAALTDATVTFNAASQVTDDSYDGLGRKTASGTDNYTWDLSSRLTEYTRGDITATATYDAVGFRLSRTVATDTRNYVWNHALGIPSISIERQGATDLRYYIHTPGGELIYSIDASSNARNFYHFDEMGNTIFVSNDAGAIIDSYAYSPFGLPSTTNVDLDNPFTWQGQLGVMDEGGGFYYIRARYYDSHDGRFISRDPLERRGPRNINPYQYALGNPLRFVDPLGRKESNWFFDVFIPWLTSPSEEESSDPDPPAVGQETLKALGDIYQPTYDPLSSDPKELEKLQKQLEGRGELYGNTAEFLNASTTLISAGCPTPGTKGVSQAATAGMTAVSVTAGAAANEPGLIERGWRAAARIIFFWD